MWIFASLYWRNPSELHESGTIFTIWSIEEERNKTKTSLHLPWSMKLSFSLPFSFSLFFFPSFFWYSPYSISIQLPYEARTLRRLFCRLNIDEFIIDVSRNEPAYSRAKSSIERFLTWIFLKSTASPSAETIDWRKVVIQQRRVLTRNRRYRRSRLKNFVIYGPKFINSRWEYSINLVELPQILNPPEKAFDKWEMRLKMPKKKQQFASDTRGTIMGII